MSRRVGSLAVALGLWPLGLVALPGTLASAAPGPTVSLGTTAVVPGQAVTVTGTGWPDQARVEAALCGDDAVGGTADCANGSTAAMAATARGLLWGQVAGAVPPVPCPCVVLVTADSLGYRRTIPVSVGGASSAPVSAPAAAAQPTVRIVSLTVRGRTTLPSAMGASSRRTVELTISNPGAAPVTPVLIGNWGRGDDPTSTIRFPRQEPLGAGRSRTVEASFEVAAFSVGTYTVEVQAQLVGYPHTAVVATTFGQWPVGLLGLAAVLLLLILLLVARRWGRRRRDRRGEPGDRASVRPEPPGPVLAHDEAGPPAAPTAARTRTPGEAVASR